MAEPIKVGLIGIGGMGRTHFGCYQNNPNAQVVAICDVDEKKRAGDWGGTALNIDTGDAGDVDLSGIAVYENHADLIADPNVQLVDICLPTRQHAEVTIASLNAGKDTFCEKPLAFTEEECEAVEAAYNASGKQLMIGHCLRFWPVYIEAKKIMDSGEYGKVLNARLHRMSGTPWWSWNNWLATGSESGGAVLDMHIHDVDTALWWFGEPNSLNADGVVVDDLPLSVEATWIYQDGKVVQIHGSWDNNGGDFDYGFKIVMENSTLVHHPSAGMNDLKIIKGGREGDQSKTIPMPEDSPYQLEVDAFVESLVTGQKMERVTPQASKVAVKYCREEMQQIATKNQT